MKEKTEELYGVLMAYLGRVVNSGATSAEVASIPEVARVLIDLIILQSKM